MTHFQQHAMLLTAAWLLIVVARFRNSRIVLIGGLFAVALYTLVALVVDNVSIQQLGLSTSVSWLGTAGFAVAWLALMIAYSPLADRLATRWIDKAPNLNAFRALQESRIKLVIGIVVAWVLGGFLEELIFRGIVLQSVEALASRALAAPIAVSLAVCAAAVGAGLVHLYQGLRAAIILTQLSILFGLLFVVSGHNLWAVMLCHGLYDTVAFIRFAGKKSKYSKLERDVSAAMPC
jgi:uncharacterized protein